MNHFSSTDYRHMAMAIREAARGQYTTSPNPNVGCVLARDDEVVATGYHHCAGEGHAEVNALAKVASAKGLTAYVTLEPCSHYGRTGPCALALIEAGVSRVVCAMQDPNPQVAGRGIAMLREAAVRVDVGLLEEEAKKLNPGFIKRMRSALPHVTVKMAMSIDGRTAMRSGESQWITGPQARSDVQRLRARSCAIVTGISSILEDDSSLTVRETQLGLDNAADVASRQPLRVVLDPANRLPEHAKILQQPGRTLRVVADSQYADSEGVVSLPGADGRIDLEGLLHYLAEREQCNNVLIEAGATLSGSIVSQGLFDQLYLYVAPTLLGSDARPLFEMPLTQMAQQRRLRLIEQRAVGDDIRYIYCASE
ncbi:MAG: bifunctional diaminohydroxyphosphoribosylaminopyrimidine deaminase/5-amino-6-(5-phosphoribosylamino)uracil reductase RibD [Pseudomonadales bacterium]